MLDIEDEELLDEQVLVINTDEIINPETGLISIVKESGIKINLVREKYTITNRSSIYDIATKACPFSWYHIFMQTAEVLETLSKNIEMSIANNNRIAPKKQNIFRPFFLCPFTEVKVIIIGGNPYSMLSDGEPLANGLPFSTNKHHTIQKDTLNIYSEIKREYPKFKRPYHGDLSKWSQQGVLLLCTSLTTPVRANYYEKVDTTTHRNKWMSFMVAVIVGLSTRHKNLVFMLWGRDAQRLVEGSRVGGKHLMLKCDHPSYTNKRSKDAFLGCGHFSQCNDYLKKHDKMIIHWDLL